MPPSKSKDPYASVVRTIEEDFRRKLKSLAGPIDEDLVAYRRRRCRRFNHILQKDIQAFTDTSDDGRWYIQAQCIISHTVFPTHLQHKQCSLTHPGDVQGSGPIFSFVSKRLEPRLLQEMRDDMFARKLQAQELFGGHPRVRSYLITGICISDFRMSEYHSERTSSHANAASDQLLICATI